VVDFAEVEHGCTRVWCSQATYAPFVVVCLTGALMFGIAFGIKRCKNHACRKPSISVGLDSWIKRCNERGFRKQTSKVQPQAQGTGAAEVKLEECCTESTASTPESTMDQMTADSADVRDEGQLSLPRLCRTDSSDLRDIAEGTHNMPRLLCYPQLQFPPKFSPKAMFSPTRRRSLRGLSFELLEAPLEEGLEQVAPGGVEKKEATSEPEKSADAVESKPKPKSKDWLPFGAARFLASMHVVTGHMYQKNALTPDWERAPGREYFYGWGYTWVVWFFMLSGFILTHAALPKKPMARDARTVLTYMLDRTVTVYPLYAMGLFLTFGVELYRGQMPSGGVLVAQTWLLQAWVPYLADKALLTHCWFISCIVPYWALFPFFISWLRKLSGRGIGCALAAMFLLPWLVLVIPWATGEQWDWYAQLPRTPNHSTHWAVLMLKFHPLCYVHVFLAGMLLAAGRSKLPNTPGMRRGMELLAPIGYLAIILVFALPGLRIYGHKISARLSILLPFQAMILLGLAGLPAQDTMMGKLFLKFEKLGEYSYGVYVFQFFCYIVYPKHQIDIWYYLFLVATAVLMTYLVQQPAQPLWRKYKRGRFLVPIALSVVFASCAWMRIPRQCSHLPSFMRHDEAMIDQRLPGSCEGSLINPSLALKNDKLVLAARRNQVRWEREIGEYAGDAATVDTTTWETRILLGEAPLEDSLQAWYRDGDMPASVLAAMNALDDWDVTYFGQEWTGLCPVERFEASNRTLLRTIRTGPEDPKLFVKGGEVGIVFSSFPPYQCGPGEAVPQMFIGAEQGDGYRMSCGMYKAAEKNWIPFIRKETLYFVASVYPHKVVVASTGGDCREQHVTTSPLLRQIAADLGGGRAIIRGGANAVYFDSSSDVDVPHYLSIFHVVSPTGHYAHFLYRFAADPPFDVLQVSQQLPLMSAMSTNGVPVAFASGIMVTEDTVVITYGAGDLESRALVFDVDRLATFFDC
jgi:hypothetical protein